MSISLRTKESKTGPSDPIDHQQNKNPQDATLGFIHTRFKELFARSEEDVYQLSKIVQLKRDSERYDSARPANIEEFFSFLKIEYDPKLSGKKLLSDEEFKLLIGVLCKYRALREYSTIWRTLCVELFSSMKEINNFLGGTAEEFRYDQQFEADLFSLLLSSSNCFQEASEDRVKIVKDLFKNYNVEMLEGRFETVLQRKIEQSRLKHPASKEKIRTQGCEIFKKHKDLLTLFQKLAEFDRGEDFLQSFIEVSEHNPHKDALQGKKEDLKRYKAYVEFNLIAEKYCRRGELDIGFDKDYRTCLKNIIDLIGDVDKIDGKKLKEIYTRSFSILDFAEKRITELRLTPEDLHSKATPFSDLFFIFDILYQITSPSELDHDFSFQALCKRSSYLSRVWLVDGHEWRQWARSLTRSLTPFERFRFDTLSSSDELVKKLDAFDKKSETGLSMFYGRSEGKILYESLEETLPSILEELTKLTLENLDTFSRENFLRDHIWIIQLLIIKNDLEASCACKAAKKLETILDPILKICEQALVSKAENDKELFEALLEEETPIEVESPKSCELEKVCTTFKETLSFKEEKKEEKFPSKTGIEKAAGETSQKKKSRKITAQDLLNLKGKNIRLIFKLLEEGGFERKRSAKGSHEIWGAKDEGDKKAVIPKHDTIKPGTLKSIADQLGLPPK